MKKPHMKTIIVNQSDLILSRKGDLDKSRVRKLMINLSFDHQEPYLYLSKTLIHLLGLKPLFPISETDACSLNYCKLFGPVKISVSKKILFVREVPDGFPPSLNLDLFVKPESEPRTKTSFIPSLPIGRAIPTPELKRAA